MFSINEGTRQKHYTGIERSILVRIDDSNGGGQTLERTKDEWSKEFQLAFEVQQKIGWEHVLFGRIVARQREPRTQYGFNDATSDSLIWTCRVIMLCWRYGLEL